MEDAKSFYFISHSVRWKMLLFIAQLVLYTRLPHLSTTDSENIPCFIANIFCSVLGFPGKYLIQVMTNSWTLLHSFISQTAAYGDKTAGNAALIMKKCHKTASWEVRHWYQHSYSGYMFLLETYFLTLSIILDFIFSIKTADFYWCIYPLTVEVQKEITAPVLEKTERFPPSPPALEHLGCRLLIQGLSR